MNEQNRASARLHSRRTLAREGALLQSCRNRTRSGVGALAPAALLLALTACNSTPPPSHPAAATPVSVDTVAVSQHTLDIKISLPGELQPYQAVDIYPRVTGFLDSIRVDVGSRVRQGEEIVRLSAPELAAQRSQEQAAVQAAEAQLASTQAKLASDQGTYSHLESAAKTPGVIAANDVQVASQTVASDKAAVSAAEQNVRAARETLKSVAQMESYLTITAPFSGVVTMRNLHPGALAGPQSGQAGSQPIVRIVDTDRLRLVVPIPEAQAGAIHNGQPVDFTVPAYPGETFHAPIARVADAVDASTRTMHVELDVRNSDGRLAAGSYATVSWPVHRAHESIFVPATAVTNDQQHTFVIRVRDSKAEWVTVQTGQAVEGEIEVFGDLRPGDQVVRMATDAIRNGQPVTAHAAAKSS